VRIALQPLSIKRLHAFDLLADQGQLARLGVNLGAQALGLQAQLRDALVQDLNTPPEGTPAALKDAPLTFQALGDLEMMPGARQQARSKGGENRCSGLELSVAHQPLVAPLHQAVEVVVVQAFEIGAQGFFEPVASYLKIAMSATQGLGDDLVDQLELL
jgi:hypothetical protein